VAYRPRDLDSELRPGTVLLGHAHAVSAKTWSSTLEIYRSLPASCLPRALRDQCYYVTECTDYTGVNVERPSSTQDAIKKEAQVIILADKSSHSGTILRLFTNT
jgi:hypothetical protein